MSTTHRFQVDMTQDELVLVERLGQLASLKTKKEVIANTIALFHWAAKELLQGRTICSIDEGTQRVKQYDSPAISAISEVARRKTELSPEEVAIRMKEARTSSKETLAKLAGGSNAVRIEMVGDSGNAVSEILE